MLNSQIINSQNKLIKNNKKETLSLEHTLQKIDKKLRKSIENNRSLHTNNNDLRNTVSRYINNSKKLETENEKLTNELSSYQDKYYLIKKKFDDVDYEKNKIFSKILDLNNSVNKKKIIEPHITNKHQKKNNKKIEENKVDLDKQINNIFRN